MPEGLSGGLSGTAGMLATGGASAIPGMALGAIQAGISLINAGKAKREAKELARTRPKREISPMYGKNLSLVESELAGGMSQAAESAYTNQLNKTTSASLSAILRGGGDVNNVADIFAGGEEGRQRLALMEDQLRLTQVGNVIKARDQMGEETDKNFLFNDWMPWADKSQANADARKTANEGIWSGLGTLAGGAMNMMAGSKGKSGNLNPVTQTPGLSNAANFNFNKPSANTGNTFNFDLYNQISDGIYGNLEGTGTSLLSLPGMGNTGMNEVGTTSFGVVDNAAEGAAPGRSPAQKISLTKRWNDVLESLGIPIKDGWR